MACRNRAICAGNPRDDPPAAGASLMPVRRWLRLMAVVANVNDAITRITATMTRAHGGAQGPPFVVTVLYPTNPAMMFGPKMTATMAQVATRRHNCSPEVY